MLRRNLNGVIKIIWDFDLNLPLVDLFQELIDFWKISLHNLKFDQVKVLDDLTEFLIQRIVSHLEDISIDKDFIKAICSFDKVYKKRIIDIVDLKNRIKSINFLKKKDLFYVIQKVITRVCKLANNGNLNTNVL